jgi:Icc-related predicted phosphoesterase
MRIICISDTHGQHHSLQLPQGDILIHAGDISTLGKPEEIEDFLDWFSNQTHRYKLFIGGNHDFYLEKEPELFELMVPKNCIYLNDSMAEVEGIKIWGSPVTPFFHNWAFNRYPGDDIRKHWKLIAEDTDILVTHSPPAGILDMTVRGIAVGDEDLKKKINYIKPKYHIFGHIHEQYGKVEQEGTTYINASYLDVRYRPSHPPVVIEYGKSVVTGSR